MKIKSIVKWGVYSIAGMGLGVLIVIAAIKKAKRDDP
jgi:hypothetical protein